MADIDELRGTPKGSTAADKLHKTLQKAAIAAAVTTAPMNATAANVQDKTVENENMQSVEVAAETVSKAEDASTADFVAEAEKLGQDVTLENIGVEIEYDRKTKTYSIREDDNVAQISEKELNHARIEGKENRQQRRKFSHQTKMKTTEIPVADWPSYPAAAFYSFENNSISTVKLTPGDIDEMVANLGLSDKSAKEKITEGLRQSVSNIQQGIDERLKLIVPHEMSHRDDDKLGAYSLAQTSPELAAKKNMLSEIKANMVESALALQTYRETGSLEDFDKVSNADLSIVKEALQKNPKLENVEALIAETVFNSWMEKNNKAGSCYSEQAYNGSTAEKVKINDSGDVPASYSAAAKITNTETVKAEYQETVDKMFAQVPGLGDVRGAVDPDFELNAELKEKISADIGMGQQGTKLMDLVVKGSETVKEATKAIKNFLKPIKKADKDGNRTDKEQQKIDQATAKLMLEKSGRVEQADKPAVKQTGEVKTNVQLALLNREHEK